MRSTTSWSMLAVALVLTGCGGSSDGTGPGGGPGGGSAAFEAQVTGDVQSQISGAATFGSGTDGNGNTLHMIQLSETGSAPGGLIRFARTGAQGFGAGTYPIVDAANGAPADGDVEVFLTDSDGNQLTAMFVGSGGSLKVTSSSGSRLAGSFTFQATGALFANPGNTLAITVTGTFAADQALGAITVTSAEIHRTR
ncbi:MAG: hypothetical protein U0133_11485 [Gemmatimonadales bacterium]